MEPTVGTDAKVIRPVETLDALADLLSYPRADFFKCLETCRQLIGSFPDDESSHIERFADSVDGLSQTSLEELYTQTFDLNPVCSLEIGWHLFGENYARGELLVELRQTLRRLDIPETTELPDHLPQVLRMLARMSAVEAQRFASRHVLKAVDKMRAGLRGKECPYEALLDAVDAVVLSPPQHSFRGGRPWLAGRTISICFCSRCCPIWPCSRCCW